MSGVNRHIRAVLDGHLTSLDGLPVVAWPNSEFKPTKGQAWVRPTLLPAQPEAIGLSGESLLHQRGIYQVSVFYPSGEHVNGAETLADAIASHFKRGTVCSSGGVVVKVSSAGSRQALPETDWYHVPVIIQYYAFTTNV